MKLVEYDHQRQCRESLIRVFAMKSLGSYDDRLDRAENLALPRLPGAFALAIQAMGLHWLTLSALAASRCNNARDAGNEPSDERLRGNEQSVFTAADSGCSLLLPIPVLLAKVSGLATPGLQSA